jgi:hypothetical protein
MEEESMKMKFSLFVVLSFLLVSSVASAVSGLNGATNTNLMLEIFRNLDRNNESVIKIVNGVTYFPVTLANAGEYETGKNVLSGTVQFPDSSTATATTDLKWKVETQNGIEANIHGVAMQWQ